MFGFGSKVVSSYNIRVETPGEYGCCSNVAVQSRSVREYPYVVHVIIVERQGLFFHVQYISYEGLAPFRGFSQCVYGFDFAWVCWEKTEYKVKRGRMSLRDLLGCSVRGFV